MATLVRKQPVQSRLFLIMDEPNLGLFYFSTNITQKWKKSLAILL